ncbi:MAG: hypothetical protein C0502_09590, partial [Opitutus sp.]|nr:hypothetical protein [Opitutus sp.]
MRFALRIGVAAFAAAALSHWLTPAGEGVPLFCFPAGIVFGALLLCEWRDWWIVVAVAGAADLATGIGSVEEGNVLHPLLHHAGISLGALTTAGLIRRRVTEIRQLALLRNPAWMLALGAGTLFLGMVAAHYPTWTGAHGPAHLLTWFMSALGGLLLVTPVWLAWSTRPQG